MKGEKTPLLDKEYIKIYENTTGFDKSQLSNICDIHNGFSTPNSDETGIHFCNKNGGEFRHLGALKYSDLKTQYFIQNDLYFTLNDFFLPKNAAYVRKTDFKFSKRNEENLRNLNALWIDLDYYKTDYNGFPYEELLNEIRMDTNIPTWNVEVNSGRGAYLIYLLNPVVNGQRRGTFEKEIQLWKKIQQKLLSILERYGADKLASNPSGVLRAPGSINSKSNTKVEYRTVDLEPYSLEELAEKLDVEFKNDTRFYKGNLSKKQKKVLDYYKSFDENYTIPSDLHLQKQAYVSLHIQSKMDDIRLLKGKEVKQKEQKNLKFTTESLYEMRRFDLEKLLELRQSNLKKNTQLVSREMFLWLYSNCFSGEKIDLTEKLTKLNSSFINPLPDSEVNQIVKQRIKKKYDKISNKYFIKTLFITKTEQKQLSCIVSKGEKQRRNFIKKTIKNRDTNGMTFRQLKALKNYQKFTEYFELYMHKSLREISSQINLSKSSIQRYIQRFKMALTEGVPRNGSLNWGALLGLGDLEINTSHFDLELYFLTDKYREKILKANAC